MAHPAPIVDDRPVRVLLVDDDEDDYHLTRAALLDLPNRRFTVDWEPDFAAALERICSGEHDVYIIDYHLGQHTGLELLNRIRERSCSGPIILLTGQGEPEIDQAALAAGAADYLEKSRLDSVLLDRMIRYAMRQHAQEWSLERKVAERTAELEAANASLREADRAKDAFLATLAHEVRNPLSSIHHALECQRLAANDAVAVADMRLLIERQVKQLTRIVNDLLDVSRLTRGKIHLLKVPMDLREAIQLAVETSRPAHEKAGIALTVQLPDKPMNFFGDHVRLVQLFTNILNNAAKYAFTGGMTTLIVEQTPSDYRVTIQDRGVGIPPEQLPKVFDLFTQINRTLDRSEGGLGIGLALVKRLVEMHDGTVTVHSAGINCGTTVTVTLPIR